MVSRGAFKRDSKPVFAEDFYSPREFRTALSRCMTPERGVENINEAANIIIMRSNIKVEELTSKISARHRMLKEKVTENFRLYSNKCLIDCIHKQERVETIDSHYNKQIKELYRISAIKY